MVILGIDGSYTRTGFAVVQISGPPGTERVLHTCIARTKATDGSDAQRCAALANRAVALASEYGVELVGIEMPYIDRKHDHGNVSLKLSALVSAFEVTLMAAGFTVTRVYTGSVNKALGIRGRHTPRAKKKEQALASVAHRYALDVTDDEADAIGVALAAYANEKKAQAGKQMAMRFAGIGRKRKPK